MKQPVQRGVDVCFEGRGAASTLDEAVCERYARRCTHWLELHRIVCIRPGTGAAAMRQRDADATRQQPSGALPTSGNFQRDLLCARHGGPCTPSADSRRLVSGGAMRNVSQLDLGDGERLCGLQCDVRITVGRSDHGQGESEQLLAARVIPRRRRLPPASWRATFSQDLLPT